MTDEDSAAIDRLVAAFYAAFDNRGGGVPDFAGLTALFAPGATISRVSASHADSWTVEQFIAPRAAILTDGTLTEFHEWETVGHTVGGDRIASRWSEYRKAGIAGGGAISGGGRKLIQLQRGGDGWLIASILWEDEDD